MKNYLQLNKVLSKNYHYLKDIKRYSSYNFEYENNHSLLLHNAAEPSS